MVELRQVSKTFGSAPVIPVLDLSVPPGCVSVLIGPSGCGKSTLLRLMMGLLWPDTGSVWIGGTQLTQGNRLLLRREMGYVIQEGGLFPHHTAVGNIALMARYLGWDQERIEKRVAELRELTQFPQEGLSRFPAELSGGQRQRVALMRALMLDPKILLLDEPLGALDPMVRAELQNDLRAIFRAVKKTVVMVTHDLAEAAFFGNRIVLLSEGRIVQEGTLNELVQAPAEPFVSRFLRAQRNPWDALAGKTE